MSASDGPETAADQPVAKVLVDVPLAHLDRLFDYSVPDELSADAVPGARVRVRFAGRLVGGFVVERLATSEHSRLQPLQRVVSSAPVLTPSIAQLARAVADRYGGTVSDVVRTAIPPRHARAEAAVAAEPEADPVVTVPLPEASVAAWDAYVGGSALLQRLAAGGRGLRAVWDAAPGGGQSIAGDWPDRIADLVQVAVPHGGVVVVVPDARDLARVDGALRARLRGEVCVALSADLGPQRRYTHFMRALTGRARVVIGTRAAVFAPVVDPVLLITWDDGDESMSEPHAPYWHAREVMALRAHLSGAALISGGFARSVESQMWIDSGWARPVTARRDVLRRIAPRVVGDDAHDEQGPARLPSRAWNAARSALEHGPVLVQVSRRGYVPGLACQRCRTPARCPACAGPLALPRPGASPTCRWCQSVAVDWRCAACHSAALRATSVGSGRTAEELGRAFPGVPVVSSSGDHVIDRIGRDGLVVATPGAEPVAEAGYAAVLILDAQSHLARAALRAGEETARRWFGAAALARPGAPVVITAAPGAPLVQALLRWDPGGFAARELAERTQLGLPPAVRVATLVGEPSAVSEVVDLLPGGVGVLGPHDVPGGDTGRSRLLLTAPRPLANELIAALQQLMATRSARKDPRPLSLHVDPLDWGADMA